MGDIVTLIEIDWKSVIVALVLLFSFIVAFLKGWEYISKKLGIETKRQLDHKLLIQTSQNLALLQEQYAQDIDQLKNTQEENAKQSIRHDELIKDEVKTFIEEVRASIIFLTKHQQQLNDESDDRDKKIEALMLGNMELLGDKIDQRFSRYVALDGIPENEVEEFDGIFVAYKALNGNHKREEKYKYVKNRMKVIPVESKLKNDE